eukprot:CAMPEP_0115465326 /NCGR_PEP_ID=MMETSP0271-20121206/49344_1 /TAXON_ID=71861 /ORGANISM="Scrippsiella trochoidea, Strain CCMP3099" /LENGTH=156 /DNA_ID=CAMNT_0002892265 /DNA_START=6 /DNA_END=472 /DNA_ORIENTATION=+
MAASGPHLEVAGCRAKPSEKTPLLHPAAARGSPSLPIVAPTSRVADPLHRTADELDPRLPSADGTCGSSDDSAALADDEEVGGQSPTRGRAGRRSAEQGRLRWRQPRIHEVAFATWVPRALMLFVAALVCFFICLRLMRRFSATSSSPSSPANGSA